MDSKLAPVSFAIMASAKVSRLPAGYDSVVPCATIICMLAHSVLLTSVVFATREPLVRSTVRRNKYISRRDEVILALSAYRTVI